MSMEHYRAAQKAGKKDLQTRTSQKLPVEMPALDAILEHVDISGEVPLGLVGYSYRTHLSVQRPVGALLLLLPTLCRSLEKTQSLRLNGLPCVMHT